MADSLLQKLQRKAGRLAGQLIKAAAAELAGAQRDLNQARTVSARRQSGAAVGRARQKLQRAQQAEPAILAGLLRDNARQLQAEVDQAEQKAAAAPTPRAAGQQRKVAERRRAAADQLASTATEIAPTRPRKPRPAPAVQVQVAPPADEPFFPDEAPRPTVEADNGAEYFAVGELGKNGGFSAEHLHLVEQLQDWFREGATVWGTYQVTEAGEVPEFWVSGVAWVGAGGKLEVRYAERQLFRAAAVDAAGALFDEYGKQQKGVGFCIPIRRKTAGEQALPVAPAAPAPAASTVPRKGKGNVAEQKRRAAERRREAKAAKIKALREAPFK